MNQRYAIIGTAQSWNLTPWADVDLIKQGLNDAYQIPGFQGANEWYDLHPLDKFYTPPSVDGKKAQIFAHQVPFGHYVRPASHLSWLATQPFPVWLAPDHATQLPDAAGWPNARAFPKAEIEAYFGRYFTSTPALMLAHNILRGAREIHIYGIHLATEQEYREQRSNFEFLIGCFLGRGKRTVKVHQKCRYYETEDVLLVLPESSPILSAPFQYAFEPSPSRKQDPLKWELHKAQVKQQRTLQALVTKPWWSPVATVQDPEHGPTRVRASTLQADLQYYEALVHDYSEQLARMQGGV